MSANEIAVMFQNGSLEGANIDIAVLLHLTGFKVAMKGRTFQCLEYATEAMWLYQEALLIGTTNWTVDINVDRVSRSPESVYEVAILFQITPPPKSIHRDS
jgi:hypothetical protein